MLEVSEAKRLRALEDENSKHTLISGCRLVRDLADLIAERGKPAMIVGDAAPPMPYSHSAGRSAWSGIA